jgi:hypothetical protein
LVAYEFDLFHPFFIINGLQEFVAYRADINHDLLYWNRSLKINRLHLSESYMGSAASMGVYIYAKIIVM